jgi:hypothetical protein
MVFTSFSKVHLDLLKMINMLLMYATGKWVYSTGVHNFTFVYASGFALVFQSTSFR